MPSVATKSFVRSENFRSKRICQPISPPIVQPRSIAIRRASARAATRRGCSRIVRPIAARAGGMRVVLPDPGGATITALRCARTWAAISATCASIGSVVCTTLGIMANDNDDTVDDDMDYTAEGSTPPQEKNEPTNDGYDEAAHNGPGKYGVKEGEGGVFGTSGGGWYSGGMPEVERPAIETERGPDERGGNSK